MERAAGIREHKNNVIDHFDCVKRIFDLYTSKERLTEVSNLPDVDTICAHEHFRMKNHAINETGLDYKSFHPEHYQGWKH